MQLDQNLQELKEQYSFFVKQKDELSIRQQNLYSATSTLKAKIQRNADVVEILETLQEEAHKKTVGVFENLLSLLIKDILPNPKSVKFELSTERGLPALDFLIDNMGQLESAVDGQGGSIVNVLSAGLRFIALQRTNLQKFLVLDEQDCWIRPDRVRQYVNVVQEISNDLNIQTIMISHHDSSFFEECSNIIKIKKNDSGQILSSNYYLKPLTTEVNDKYISQIRLINFMSHEDTIIKLHPNVNVIIGENDIGKSAIVAGLRAVFYGESSETFIKHGAKSCAVEITMSNNVKILWQRFTKKSNGTVSYSLLENDVVKNETNKKDVPQWVLDEINIQKIEGMDICLQNQKQPTFLLSDSPSKKASILSIGRDSSYIQKMIQKNKELIGFYNQSVKQNEKEYNINSLKLTAINSFITLFEKNELPNKNEIIKTKQASINDVVKKIEFFKKFNNVLAVAPPKTLKVPNINNQINLDINKRNRLAQIANTLTINFPKLINKPQLKDAQGDLKTLLKLRQINVILNISQSNTSLSFSSNTIGKIIDNVKNETSLQENMTLKFNSEQQLNQINVKIKALNIKQNDVKKTISEVIGAENGLCPICKQHINNIDVLLGV